MKRAPIAVIGGLIITCLAAALSSRVTLDGDLARMLPDSNPQLRRAAVIVGRAMEWVVIDFSLPEDHEDRFEELGAAADHLGELLRASDEFADVRTMAFAGDILESADALQASAARLLDAAQLAEIEAELRPENIEARLADLRRRAHEPDSSFMLSYALADPLGISTRVLAPMEALTAGLGDVRIVQGRIVTADGGHLLVIAEPSFRATETDRSEQLVATLSESIEALGAQPRFAHVEVRHLSVHRSTLDNVGQIRRDVAITSSVGAVFVALIAIFTLARFWWGILALLPALFGGVVALATLSLFRNSVAAPVVGFGVALLGISVDYAIHVLYRLDSGRDSRLPVRALFMGATTTAFAFLTLRASSLPALREIGLLGAIGVIAAAAFAVFVLPQLARGSRPERRRRFDLRGMMMRLPTRPRRRWVLAALLVTPVFLFGAGRLELDSDVTRLSSLSADAKADEEGLTETWGETFRSAQVVVAGGDFQAALRADYALNARLRTAGDRSEIQGHVSVSTFFPPLEEQERRLAAWRDFWSPERLATLRRDLTAAGDAQGFNVEAFEAFFEWIVSDPPALDFQPGSESPLGSLIADRVLEHDGGILLMSSVFTEGQPQVTALKRALAEEMPEVLVFHKEAMVLELAQLIGNELWKLSGLALLAVALLVWLWVGTVELSLLVMIPLLISCAWTFGTLGWLGIRINLANSIFAVFLFGLSVDYAIFMAQARLERFRGGADHLAETDASVTLCALTTCVGFGVLVWAGHPVLFSVGITALIGIVGAFLATRLFVPVLSDLVLRQHGPGGTPRLRHMLRALWVTRVMAFGGLRFLLLTRWFTPREDRRRAAQNVLQRVSTRVLERVRGGRYVIRGVTPEKFAEPVIIVANHESHFDQAILLSMPTPLTIVVKEWVSRVPVVGALGREAGFIVADANSVEDLTERAREALAEGTSVLVYPEGTRTRNGRIGRFHKGAFTLARTLGVKVLPVALVNTGSAVRAGTWWIGNHDACTVVLDLVDPRDFSGPSADRDMARTVREQIRDVRRAEWLETCRGPVWDLQLADMYAFLGTGPRRRATADLKRDPLLRELPDVLPGEGSVLVVGCGLGLHAARMSVAFPERKIIVLESDPERLRLAQAALGAPLNVDWRSQELDDIEGEECESALLLHEPGKLEGEPQRLRLRRIAELLPRGGRLLVRSSDHSESAAARVSGGASSHAYRAEGGWGSLLRECGFEVERTWPEFASGRGATVLCRRT